MEEKSDVKKRVSRDSWARSKRILSYLKEYKWRFAFGLGLLFASSITTLIVPRLMGQMAGIGIDDSTSSWDLQIAGRSIDMTELNTVAVVLFIVFVLQAIISFLKVYVFSFVTEHMMRDLRKDVFAHMIRLPMTYFNEQRVGDLNSRISADIASIQETFNITLSEFIRQIVIIILGVAFLFYSSPRLTVIMLVTLPIIMIVAVLFGRFIRKLSKRTQDLVAESNVVVQESLSGIVNVKSFTNEFFESMRYVRNINEVKKIAIKSGIWRGLFSAFIIIFIFGAIGLVILQGAKLMELPDTDPDYLEPALFFSFLLYTVMIAASFGGIANQYSSLQRAVGSVESVLDIMDMPIEPLSVEPDNREFQRISGAIAMRDLHFTYPSRPDVPILKGIDLDISPGQRIALVGPSGSGKSTLASMILQFYQPDQGSVSFDNRAAADYNLNHLRSQMAYVPQEIILFGGTIRDNIAYGRPDSSDEAIIEAAKGAQAWEFISRFEDGLDTLVGDRGIQLSGGQKQRIAIARALLRDPAILILDEATSSLDSSSEALVQKALDTLMKGRTSLVIAHRLSTIRNVDKILVIVGGHVTESGTHDELIALGGTYTDLSALQNEQIA